MKESCFYVVATPIGNLEDLTPRAKRILSSVGLIAAEDTRHTIRLLQHHGIDTRLMACHDHNEERASQKIVAHLRAGQSVALVCDAGTPLISDPGYHVVRAVRHAGFSTVPVPGACALVAALSVSGLPSDRFFFEGFLPAKTVARRKRMAELASFSHTWIVYESPHRIVAMLADLLEVTGPARHVVQARELTKTFETVLSGTVAELHARLTADEQQRKGEFVVLVAGAEPRVAALDNMPDSVRRVLGELVCQLPVKQACRYLAEITDYTPNDLYQAALLIKQEKEAEEPQMVTKKR